MTPNEIIEKASAKNEGPGIYMILCLANNKCYIGHSLNIYKRKLKHFAALKTQKHHNSHLQNSYNKYGKGKFSFIPLENTNDLFEREAYWLSLVDKEFSMNLSAVFGDEIKVRASDERRKKQSEDRLKWIENNPDKVKDMQRASKEAMSKYEVRLRLSLSERTLTTQQVNEMRRLKLEGKSPKELGLLFNVSSAVAGQICKGGSYVLGPGINKDLIDKCKLTIRKVNTISPETINDIRRKKLEGVRDKDLIKMFNICQQTIWKITRGIIYRNGPKIDQSLLTERMK